MVAFAAWALAACSSSGQSATPDAAATDDATPSDDATTPTPDGTAPDGGDAADATDSGDANSHYDSGDANSPYDSGDAGNNANRCEPVIQTDAGAGVCPAAGGSFTGQEVLYPCGLPADIFPDAAADAGNAFVCMTLCNDITHCYWAEAGTPDAGPLPPVLVTCCP